ncbi:dockerin type I domain-containing protein [Herbivorax sp. ANBcel31]|uniref:RCC1 domain-containing protein n=1 Tax=Herbivorax sp. ANBcel31 TaxID=3069754 RepID=UPI0027B0511F|nr:dockerin type I domain-containing protein [Herbivorax sp. ANBcel31]MDQ2086550.1 dockerin type I domain-containing protein [Herbivorax sp. ANBcel31]
MRKVRSFLFACLSLSMVFTVLMGVSPIETRANTDDGEFIYGDLNGDGNIDSTDAALLTRYMLEIISDFPSPDGMKAADLNGDGEIDSIDYTLLSRRLLDIIDHFPVEDASPTPDPIDTEPPTIPQSVEVTEITDTTATLKWDSSNDNEAVEGYNIYSDGTKVKTTTDTTATLTELLSNQKYLFSVTAFDEAGNESDASDYVEVTTLSEEAIPTGFVQVETGSSFAVALKENGTVWTWGESSVVDANHTISQVVGIDNVKSISTGNSFVLALKEDGSVWAWGWNENGELGIGNNEHSSVPVQIKGLSNVKNIFAGDYQSFAITEEGSVWAWGRNNRGLLGIGNTVNSNIPVKLTDFNDVEEISSSRDHTIALKEDGSVWTWGAPPGAPLMERNEKPVNVPEISNAVSVSAGQEHFLVLKEDGSVLAWGSNLSNQLGDGTSEDSNIPIEVTGLTDVKLIHAGSAFSLAVKKDGSVLAWGSNSTLGISSEIPIKITELSDVRSISTSYNHILAILENGDIWAWGSNRSGQLGNVELYNNSVPIKVDYEESEIIKSSHFREFYTNRTFYLELDELGNVWSWQTNEEKEKILSDIDDIFTTNNVCLALKKDGTVWAWGSNILNQLPNSTDSYNLNPEEVTYLEDIIAIETGSQHSVVLKKDGTVWTWGENNFGQLGIGTNENTNVPTQVPDVENIIEIKAYGSNTFALGDDGSIWAWGHGSELTNTPTKLTTLSGIETYYDRSFAVTLKDDGTVWTWGRNNFGQLGNGTYEDSDVPVKVKDLDGVKSISSNGSHVLALKEDGTIWGWGNNSSGQLGNGTYISSNIPVKAIGENFVELSGTNAFKEDGSMYSFGVLFNHDATEPIKVRDVDDAGIRYLLANNEVVEGFKEDMYEFSITAPFESAPEIDAVTYHPDATVEIMQPDAWGTATIEVTAPDGITKETYTVNVNF